MPVADQSVYSPGFCINELGTESSPLDAAVKTVMSLASVARSSSQSESAALCALAAAVAARLALKFANQLMGKG